MRHDPVHLLFVTSWYVVLSVAQPIHSAAAASSLPSGTSSLDVTVALVDQSMSVRPVPLHALQLISAVGDTLTARTDGEGRAIFLAPLGKHTIRSVSATAYSGQLYRWDMPLLLTSKAMSITLSNDNATITEATNNTPRASNDNRAAAASHLFKTLAGAVVRIQSGLAHGTGFLADTLGGVVITNAHVIDNSEADRISVCLTPTTRVMSRVLARDPEADIAILQLHPTHTKDLPRIPLQSIVAAAPVEPGETLIAMGYPLSQELTVTTGIASSVRAGAIISDVNINPGNSGGPLLNSDGVAVAINTFGDFGGAGPGVSGSILVSRAAPALAQAAGELSRAEPPSPALLPSFPQEKFELATLKQIAEATDLKLYRDFSDIDVAGFTVSLSTPLSNFVAIKAHEADIAKDRKKREARAGLAESERFSEIREIRDWSEYVGNLNQPLVAISVVPKVGETGGSLFARMMLGPGLQATYKFKGDVRGMELFRGEVPVEAIKGGHAPMKMYLQDRWVSLKDVADMGYYLYDPEVFRPDSLGAPPQVSIAIRDLKNPKRLKCRELSPEVIARVWNDFESYYAEKRPGDGFQASNAKAANDRPSLREGTFLDHECDWSYFR